MGIVNDMLHEQRISHGFLTFLNMLQPRWIITKIDGKAAGTLEEAEEVYNGVVDAAPKRTRVVLEYIRGGISRVAVLDFSKEYKSD